MNPEIGGCTTKQASMKNLGVTGVTVPYFGWSPPTGIFRHFITYSGDYLAYVFTFHNRNFIWYSVECFICRSSWHFFWHSLRHLEHVDTSISCCFHIKLVIKPLDTQYVIIPVGEIPLVRTRSINQGTTLTSYVKSSKLGRLAHMKCVWKWMKAVACPGWFQQKFV
jgi:hypothetical protein